MSCLVAMTGPAAEPASTSGAWSRPVATAQQNPGRPPDAVLRSVAARDFTLVVRDILVAAGQPQIAIRLRPSEGAKTAGASVDGGQRTIE